MHEYFRLFQHSSQGLIVGNVELVEDRIPGTLLSFPLKNDKDKTQMPPEGWPRTGFVHEALFFVEVRFLVCGRQVEKLQDQHLTTACCLFRRPRNLLVS